jgi:hypothetical protein
LKGIQIEELRGGKEKGFFLLKIYDSRNLGKI